jgi:uncharacterized protein with HEPN domain
MSRNITLYIKDILQNMSDAEDFYQWYVYRRNHHANILHFMQKSD